MKVVFILVGVVLLAAIVAERACFYFENPQLRFDTWNDAIKSGQTGQGKWIPSYLPVTARDIRATYSVDSRHTLISFRFQPKGDTGLPGHCHSVEAGLVQFPYRYVRWWPSELRGEKGNHGEYVYFACGKTAFFAFNQDRGYFWRL